MGIILNGILGKVSGKVAGVVGASWKDKAYLRAYVKPANPNTAAQQVQRTKFSDVVAFCKPLVGQVFNTYTDKFQKSMSGFNFFIKKNIDIFEGTPEYSSVLITEGPLSVPLITTAILTGSLMEIEWTANNGNNGKDDDGVFAAVYHKVSGIWFFASSESPRSVQAITVGLLNETEAADYECWIWAKQDVNSILDKISNSSQTVATES